MKQAEIIIGGTYVTRIGQSLVRVIVVRAVESHPYLSARKQVRFAVRRVDEARELPKTRTAAALRLP